MTTRPRGIVFVSLLALMVVVMMLTGAFLARSQSTLFGASSYRDGVRAEQAARAGINHLFTLLDDDRSFSRPLQGELDGATYSFTFDADEPYFSVNNLSQNSAATQRSWQGYEVSPHSADLVVVGQCGHSRRALRVVVQEGMSSVRSVAAVGRVQMSGDVTIDGVKSLTPPPGQERPEPAPGGIISKHRTTDSATQAISWNDGGGANFELSSLSRLETAPADSGLDSISSNVTALYPEQVIDEGAADAIPEIDVAARVQAGMSSPTLPGGPVQAGYVVVKDDRSHSGNLTINGDLVLNQGTLYVDGDLTINGGLEGLGGLFVSGDITVRGGNSVVQTGQPSGVAMLAGDDIRLEGLDLATYLGAISSSDPVFSAAVSNMRARLTDYKTTTNFWGVSHQLGKTQGPGGVSWISPYPGPDGTFNFGDSTGAVPAVARHTKAYALTHPTDLRAQKLASAMEELQFFFRSNLHNVRVNHEGEMVGDSPAGPGSIPLFRLDDYQLGLLSTNAVVPPVGSDPLGAFHSQPNDYLGNQWDDLSLPIEAYTHDHIGYGGSFDQHDARRKAFLLYNPEDLSWLGKSSIQGIVYAGGDIHADTNFRIIGSLISLGDVTLTNGSTRIFNEEYRSLLGSRLPIGLVHVEEL